MPLELIHSYLVHPGRGLDEQPAIQGTRVRARGALYDMLRGVYERAQIECDTAIIFRAGAQINEVRTRLQEYLRTPTMAAGRTLASRLQSASTNRSGLGLIFVMTGTEGRQHRIVLSRFPAEQGVVAHDEHGRFVLEFVDRVFMKSATAYKSALYEGVSIDADFWDGYAVDKQINSTREVSNYWINDFLDSELKTTPVFGTRRLAEALRGAVGRVGSVELKQELLGFGQMLRGQAGRRVSAEGAAATFGLSEDAALALRRSFPRPELYADVFQIDRQEFERVVGFRTVELDNGGLLTAQSGTFDEVFSQQPVGAHPGMIRFSTEGRVVDERLRKGK